VLGPVLAGLSCPHNACCHGSRFRSRSNLGGEVGAPRTPGAEGLRDGPRRWDMRGDGRAAGSMRLKGRSQGFDSLNPNSKFN
jgi:hypothetical protein